MEFMLKNTNNKQIKESFKELKKEKPKINDFKEFQKSEFTETLLKEFIKYIQDKEETS